MDWAEVEFQDIDLAERPTASLPGACNGWSETQAAYRLLGWNRMIGWTFVKTIWLGLPRVEDFAAHGWGYDREEGPFIRDAERR